MNPSTRKPGARRLARPMIAALALALAGCGGDDESAAEVRQENTDHVFKGQTEAIDRARDVERQLRESRRE